MLKSFQKTKIRMTEKNEAGFWEHLRELRKRLFRSIISISIASIICLTQIKKIWSVLLLPLPNSKGMVLQNIAPLESLLIDFKLSLLAGLFLASPVVFYQLYCFVGPALYPKEKKIVLPMVFFSVLFFSLGAFFAFYVVLPLSLSFLQSYAEGVAQQNWTQVNYSSFITKMILAFSIMFQLPVFTFLLAKLGLITSKFMLSQFKFALLIIFIIAAILTPPEFISQILLAIPIIILYLLSVGIAHIVNPVKEQ